MDSRRRYSPSGWRRADFIAARPSTAPVRLIGVYDADGSILGEISYWIGARLGTRHCALCDITHGLFREKSEWRECEGALSVPIELMHRDELSPAMRRTCADSLPCVLAERPDGSLEVVLGPEELENCAGEPERLAERLSLLAGPRRR